MKVALALCLLMSCATCCFASSDGPTYFEQLLRPSDSCPAVEAVTRPAASAVHCSALCLQLGPADCQSFAFAQSTASPPSISPPGECAMSPEAGCRIRPGLPVFQRPGAVGPTVTEPSSTVAEAPTAGSSACPSQCHVCYGSETYLLIMKAETGDVGFARPWAEYEAGFGSCATDYWMGLSAMHSLTAAGGRILRFEAVDNYDGAHYSVLYSGFTVGPASDKYRLGLGALLSENYTDTRDLFIYHNGAQFSTYDSSNECQCSPKPSCCLNLDSCSNRNENVGWWFTNCYTVFLTGYPSSYLVGASLGATRMMVLV